MFLIDFTASFLGGFLGAFAALFWFKGALNTRDEMPILGKVPNMMKRAPQAKRAPKALTDQMAYAREILEEGQNRG